MSIDEKTILQIRNTAKSAIPSGSKAILFGSRARGVTPIKIQIGTF